MNETDINWADKSWNPITGCTKIAPGCKNCYAETMFNRIGMMPIVPEIYRGRRFTDVIFHPTRLNDQDLKVRKHKYIFVNSMSDTFHEKISFLDVFRIYQTMGKYYQHTFIILTKRLQRACDFYERLRSAAPDFQIPKNIWIGYSIAVQKDLEIDRLYEIPAAVHFLSIEPLLEKINLEKANRINPLTGMNEKPDWIIVGGESGSKARECNIEHIRSVVDQCREYKIPVWVKQLGSNPVYDREGIYKGVKIMINHKSKNEDIEKFPPDLRIRQLPGDLLL